MHEEDDSAGYVIQPSVLLMLYYPTSRLCRGKGLALDLDLTPKLAPYVGKLTAHYVHVQPEVQMNINSQIHT